DKVLREISKEKSVAAVWLKLESLYMTKSLANRLFLKQRLYTFKMPSGKSLEDHLDEDEDQALLLLSSLPSEYNSLSDTFIYGRDSLSLDEVKAALFSKELKKKLEGGGYQDAEGLYTRG
ncbi:Retrovirus-related Pol polyprotein from transposon TNT 1-94, partial [Glycine soja]